MMRSGTATARPVARVEWDSLEGVVALKRGISGVSADVLASGCSRGRHSRGASSARAIARCQSAAGIAGAFPFVVSEPRADGCEEALFDALQELHFRVLQRFLLMFGGGGWRGCPPRLAALCGDCSQSEKPLITGIGESCCVRERQFLGKRGSGVLSALQAARPDVAIDGGEHKRVMPGTSGRRAPPQAARRLVRMRGRAAPCSRPSRASPSSASVASAARILWAASR